MEITNVDKLKSKSYVYISLNEVLVLFVIVVSQPVLRSLRVGLSVLFQFTFLDQELFSLGSWAFLPLSWIGLSVHDDSFGLGNNTMITAANFGSCHL
jgi:hypothetical protein